MVLTKASKLGLYALTEMALRPGELVSASAIAGRFDASENHVAKVLQQLARSGLVQSMRGVGGGYSLARPAGEITMADVARSIEGAIAVDDCEACPFHAESGACSDRASCNVHRLLADISSYALYTLESVTIATLARSKPAPRPPHQP